MTKVEIIKNLNSFINTKDFIQKNPMNSLTIDELSALQVQLGILNSHYQMDAFFALVTGEINLRQTQKGERRNFWMSIVSVIAALTSVLFAGLTYYFK